MSTVKVDGSFTAAMTKDGADYALVQAVVSLAHAIGMAVVAEGIDAGGQLAALRRIGCDFGQDHPLRRGARSQRHRAILGEGPALAWRRPIAPQASQGRLDWLIEPGRP